MLLKNPHFRHTIGKRIIHPLEEHCCPSLYALLSFIISSPESLTICRIDRTAANQSRFIPLYLRHKDTEGRESQSENVRDIIGRASRTYDAPTRNVTILVRFLSER